MRRKIFSIINDILHTHTPFIVIFMGLATYRLFLVLFGDFVDYKNGIRNLSVCCIKPENTFQLNYSTNAKDEIVCFKR